MIIPIWKNIGQSTHQLAKKVGELTVLKTKNPDDLKSTHTGTLDPMAEGIIIVLTGEDRFNKSEFSKKRKEYEFSILFGVDTDTNDLLGLQTKENYYQLNISEVETNLKSLLPKYIGELKQTQPRFSAQRIDGKSAFDKAKIGEPFVAIKNNITIFSLEILESKTISPDELLITTTQKINLVQGDFRQKEIIKNWYNTIHKLKQNNITNLPLIKIRAEVSKRTYIRSLVRDLAKELSLSATTFSIIRTKNENFTKHDIKS
jgi:tRNA pseudouridine55 synthase